MLVDLNRIFYITYALLFPKTYKQVDWMTSRTSMPASNKNKPNLKLRVKLEDDV